MKPAPEKQTRLDLAAVRKKLRGASGQRYWRGLEEIAATDEFNELLEREFPAGASEWISSLDRRSFLKVAAASLALAGLNACTKQPVHAILPYVKQPENFVPGEPFFYATSMVFGGYATGVLAKSREGHPIKLDGSPEHPAALGASSVWLQASILDLYDPDRSQSVIRNGDNSSWLEFLSELNEVAGEHRAKQGAGLRFLTETITSPTLAAQFDDLLRRFPKAKLHSFEPVCLDNVHEGARIAFGEVVETQHRFDKAELVVSLDSDFLCTHPQRLRYTRDFANSRRVSAGGKVMNRLYVIESTPTITGSMADHRFPLASGAIQNVARRILDEILGKAPPAPDEFSAMIQDLLTHRGSSIVVAGEWQPPVVHALAHLLNDKLGNAGKTLFYTPSAEQHLSQQVASLRELVAEMKSGAVETLFIFGGNPVYSAPADFEFDKALLKVRRSIHLGTEYNETAALGTWHIPQTHYLESWGDARAFDGTVSLQQPLIAPLYDGKSACEILDALANPQQSRSDYEIVRDHWRQEKLGEDFEKNWRRAICDGLIAGTASRERQMDLRTEDILAAAARTVSENDEKNLEITFRPDPSVWDGRFANNAWLQECAKPISKLTWDNAILISPALAERERLETDDVIELKVQGRTVRGSVWVMPGQAANSITLHLGYGRERAGRIGRGVGFNAYRLRTSDGLWQASGVQLTKFNERHHLVSTQLHHSLHSPERQIYREGTLQEFLNKPEFIKRAVESPARTDTLYNANEFNYDGYRWGMSIDLNTCIGCNACLLACEVENNIPAVGKAQVNAHREMYWIRIDTYYKGPAENPEFSHMPVPCMHCEHAPCELVCPVAATVHDHEGLNLMIYNRCIGTRFCSNNCPYKVRRFNFLHFSDYRTPSLKPMYNPEVTVRSRGVMEKCSYCIQRIARARITAEKENRRIREGEVRTACQDACPAEAIVFGDLNSPGSELAKLKAHPLDYSMLGELNTRPRTTYLAKLRNPNPNLANEIAGARKEAT